MPPEKLISFVTHVSTDLFKGGDKMAEAVEKVPGETRWTIATKALTGVLIVTGKTLRDIVGEKRFDEIWGQVWAGAGKASKEIADALGLAGNDAKSVAEAFQSVVLVSMGPEIESETIEATADKAVVRVTGCPWWNRFNELDQIYAARRPIL